MKMNKFLYILFLSLFVLVSCTQKEIEENKETEAVEKDIYIDPVRDVFIFGELQETLKEEIKTANGHAEYSNYQFKMLQKELYEQPLHDIEGNEIILSQYDNLVLEIVSVQCSHCMKQLHVLSKLIEGKDITFVQYFNVGKKEDILDMYQKEDVQIDDRMILIGEDEGMKDYVKNILGVKSYPTLLSFKDGKVSFDATGEADETSFSMFLKLGFDEIIDVHELKDEDGNELLSLSRSIDDVKNDLSLENREKLEALDHDDYTCQLTYQLMGKKVDFSLISNSYSEVYMNEVDDFSLYEEEKLVLIYTYLRDNSETDKVEFINDLIKDDDDIQAIVVLIEGLESSSAALKNMKIRFLCPVVSILGRMPDAFYSFGLAAYPTAVFIDKGVFTGAYSMIESKEKFAEAKDLFLSENCIAYKRNNQTNASSE